MEMVVVFEIVRCGLHTNDLDADRILNRHETDRRKCIMVRGWSNKILLQIFSNNTTTVITVKRKNLDVF